MEGNKADLDDHRNWNRCGKFVGEFEIDPVSVMYRYSQAEEAGGQNRLTQLTEQRVLAL